VESFHTKSNIYGDVNPVVHSSLNDELDILVKVTLNNDNVFLEKFEGFTAGEDIYIRIDNSEINGFYTEETTEEAEENTTVNDSEVAMEEESVAMEEEAAEGGDSITGLAVSEDGVNGGVSWVFYVILLSILIAGVIGFLVFRRFKFKGKNSNVPSNKPETGIEAGVSAEGGADIQVLESKIKEAQRELVLIKNKGKIEIAEEKLRKDQEELDKLREWSSE